MELQARKSRFESALRAHLSGSTGAGEGGIKELPEGVRWTTGDARDLEEAVERARRGMLFLALK